MKKFLCLLVFVCAACCACENKSVEAEELMNSDTTITTVDTTVVDSLITDTLK